MNDTHSPVAHQTEDQGTIKSYVVGFILSILFTVVPYLLVTRKIMSGNMLLVVILALAFIQMLVQIVYFLHLGRGPKPLYNIVFFGATAGLILLVVGASILIMSNLYRNMSPEEITLRMAQEENIAELNGNRTGACQGNNANHEVVFNDGALTPAFIEARRCDTLTIKSGDGSDHTFIFGVGNEPASFGGEFEVKVRASRPKIITLNEIGEFTLLQEHEGGVVGRFIVLP